MELCQHHGFHPTWLALKRQLETRRSIAHMRNLNRTQMLEAVNIAKHLHEKVGDPLDKTTPE